MARRASTISTTSLTAFKTHADSILSPGYFDASPSSAVTSANGQVRPPLRTSSLSTYRFPKHNNDNPYIDPDDLFAQRTVAEVKSVQMQLRWVTTCWTYTNNRSYNNFQSGCSREAGGATTYGRVRSIMSCIINSLDIYNARVVNGTVTFCKLLHL